MKGCPDLPGDIRLHFSGYACRPHDLPAVTQSVCTGLVSVRDAPGKQDTVSQTAMLAAIGEHTGKLIPVMDTGRLDTRHNFILY